MYDKNTNSNISIFFFANKKYEFSTFFDNLQLFRKKKVKFSVIRKIMVYVLLDLIFF